MRIHVLDPESSDPTWGPVSDTLTLDLNDLEAIDLNTGEKTVREILDARERPLHTFDVAIIVSVPADSYGKALQEADRLAAGIGDTEQLSVSAVTCYERDNDGQRVLYLHSVG